MMAMSMVIASLGACGGEPMNVDRDGAPDGGARPDATTSREFLSEVGLYSDIDEKILSPEVMAYEPSHALWSDGAEKRRWLWLPPGAIVDSDDMEHWQLPVGAKLFKEFSTGDRLLETRMIERLGPGPDDFWVGAFVWNEDGSDAVFTVDGAENVNGTSHDVPSAESCWTCHIGEPGRVLGFSALQLAHDGGGLTLAGLVDASLLSDPPSNPDAIGIPGNATARAALGSLHANCGHCHNENGSSWPDTDVVLRLSRNAASVTETETYQTTARVSLDSWMDPDVTMRLVPGDAESSALVARMAARGDGDQMPPIATEAVDQAGLDAVSAWIESLPSTGGSARSRREASASAPLY